MSNKISYIPPDKITVGYSDVEGIGVFAVKDISEGDIVERCPMVDFGWRSQYLNDPTIWQYCYFQPKCDCNDCKNHGSIVWMVLGYGMLYNHQDMPNTKWSFNYKERYADVVASKNIAAGEEIFVSYGSTYFNNRKKITVNKEQTDMIDEDESDEEFLQKINDLMKSPEPEPEPEEDDETFMARMSSLMQNPAPPSRIKSVEEIAEEIRLYGAPLDAHTDIV